MASILTLGITSAIVYYDNINKKNEIVLAESLMDPATMNDKMVDNEITSTPEVEVKEERIEVYEGMTYDELVEKLNRTLSSDLTNMGYAYATYSLELGVDPYLAVAISMHETGCTWNCSYLLKACNNVGGQKGEGCGSYRAYDTLEEGIYGFIANIKNNYVDYGLYTAEEMNPKYAEDPMWASKVNNYIEKIRNN